MDTIKLPSQIRRLLTAATVSLLVIANATVFAQPRRPRMSSPDNCPQLISERGHAGDRVKLTFVDNSKCRGEFVSASDTRLLLRMDLGSNRTHDSTIEIQQIKQINFSRKSKAKPALTAVLGACAGAACGVLIATSVTSSDRPYGYTDDLKSGMIGGIVGFVVGGTVGFAAGGGLRTSVTLKCF